MVFDQGSLFQTLLQATQSVATVTRAPVERVVAFLSQYSQCQPSLVSANASGVWVASGRNQLHLARGSLVGQWSPDDFRILQYCAVYYCTVYFSHQFFVFVYQELSGRMLFPEEPSPPPGGPSSRLQLCLTEKVTHLFPTHSHTHHQSTSVSHLIITQPVSHLCLRYVPMVGSEQEGSVLCLGPGWRAPPLLCPSPT